jgi:hypothetical protein
MFPPNYTRVLKEDLGKDVPQWTDKVLYQLNLVTDYLSIAFKKNITLQDNLSNPVKQITLKAGATPASNTVSFLVSLPSGYQPLGVVILNCVDNSGVVVGAAVTAEMQPGLVNSNVVIRAIYGLTSGHSYTLTFLVF